MSNPWINYHHLLYFKTIAEEQSVSKAAQKLLLGQPTLSAQLKQFEDSIGVQLFERHHKKLILTEHGKLALDYARNIFKLGNEMYEALHDRLSPSRIHLQIGALDSIPKQIILQLSKAAYEVAPCTISLIEGKPDEMIRELTSHRIDLFVTNALPSPREANELSHRLVIQRPISIFGSAKFKALRRNFPHSISGEKFILPTYDSKLRNDFEHWAKLNNITLDVIAETQDVSLKKLMASEGLGLIPAAPYIVTHAQKSHDLIELGQVSGIYEQLYLVSIDRKIDNPVAAHLMKNFNLTNNESVL